MPTRLNGSAQAHNRTDRRRRANTAGGRRNNSNRRSQDLAHQNSSPSRLDQARTQQSRYRFPLVPQFQYPRSHQPVGPQQRSLTSRHSPLTVPLRHGIPSREEQIVQERLRERDRREQDIVRSLEAVDERTHSDRARPTPAPQLDQWGLVNIAHFRHNAQPGGWIWQDGAHLPPDLPPEGALVEIDSEADEENVRDRRAKTLPPSGRPKWQSKSPPPGQKTKNAPTPYKSGFTAINHPAPASAQAAGSSALPLQPKPQSNDLSNRAQASEATTRGESINLQSQTSKRSHRSVFHVVNTAPHEHSVTSSGSSAPDVRGGPSTVSRSNRARAPPDSLTTQRNTTENTRVTPSRHPRTDIPWSSPTSSHRGLSSSSGRKQSVAHTTASQPLDLNSQPPQISSSQEPLRNAARPTSRPIKQENAQSTDSIRQQHLSSGSHLQEPPEIDQETIKVSMTPQITDYSLPLPSGLTVSSLAIDTVREPSPLSSIVVLNSISRRADIDVSQARSANDSNDGSSTRLRQTGSRNASRASSPLLGTVDQSNRVFSRHEYADDEVDVVDEVVEEAFNLVNYLPDTLERVSIPLEGQSRSQSESRRPARDAAVPTIETSPARNSLHTDRMAFPQFGERGTSRLGPPSNDVRRRHHSEQQVLEQRWKEMISGDRLFPLDSVTRMDVTPANVRRYKVHWGRTAVPRHDIEQRVNMARFVTIGDRMCDIDGIEEIPGGVEENRYVMVYWKPTWEVESNLKTAEEALAAFHAGTPLRFAPFRPPVVDSIAATIFRSEPGMDYLPAIRSRIAICEGALSHLPRDFPAAADRRAVVFTDRIRVDVSNPYHRPAIFAYASGIRQSRPCQPCQKSPRAMQFCVVQVQSKRFSGACTNCAFYGSGNNACNYHNDREYTLLLQEAAQLTAYQQRNSRNGLQRKSMMTRFLQLCRMGLLLTKQMVLPTSVTNQHSCRLAPML